MIPRVSVGSASGTFTSVKRACCCANCPRCVKLLHESTSQHHVLNVRAVTTHPYGDVDVLEGVGAVRQLETVLINVPLGERDEARGVRQGLPRRVVPEHGQGL